MLSTSINVFRSMVAYGDGLVADITAEEFCHQPVAGMNHPGWIFGHLAFSADRHATFLGGEPQLGAWKELFGKGSAMSTDGAGYPTKEALLTAWRAAADRYVAIVEAATPEQLSAPNTYVRPEELPTLGDFITFSMTGHTSLHLGQLSAWRRAMGRPSLF